MTTQFETMAEVINANRRIGHYFFEASSKRFFDSRIGTKLFGGRFFITSEQFHGSDGYHATRKYTVREVKPDGSVNTYGEFQAYTSNSAARDAILYAIGIDLLERTAAL